MFCLFTFHLATDYCKYANNGARHQVLQRDLLADLFAAVKL
jgi:hypothetical protein